MRATCCIKGQENETEAKIKAGFFHVSDVEMTAVKGLSYLQKSRKSSKQANKQGRTTKRNHSVITENQTVIIENSSAITVNHTAVFFVNGIFTQIK